MQSDEHVVIGRQSTPGVDLGVHVPDRAEQRQCLVDHVAAQSSRRPPPWAGGRAPPGSSRARAASARTATRTTRTRELPPSSRRTA